MTYIPDMPHFKFFKHKILLQSDVNYWCCQVINTALQFINYWRLCTPSTQDLWKSYMAGDMNYHFMILPQKEPHVLASHITKPVWNTQPYMNKKTSSYKSFHRRIYICMYNKLWKCFCTTRVDKLHHWPTDHIIDGSGMPRHFATRDCATAASSSENKWAISASVFDRSMAWLSNSMAFSKHPLQQLHKAAYFVEWMEHLLKEEQWPNGGYLIGHLWLAAHTHAHTPFNGNFPCNVG